MGQAGGAAHVLGVDEELGRVGQLVEHRQREQRDRTRAAADLLDQLGVEPAPLGRLHPGRRDVGQRADQEARHRGGVVLAHPNVRGEVVSRLEEELFEIYRDENLDVKPKQLEQRGANLRPMNPMPQKKKLKKSRSTPPRGSMERCSSPALAPTS